MVVLVRFTVLCVFLFAAAISSSVYAKGGQMLSLTRDSQSSYVVVLPDDPTTVDVYAAGVLTNMLYQASGASLPVLEKFAGRAATGADAIFIGLGTEALARLSNSIPLPELADEEHIACSQGNDIFLYGGGVRGNLYAVMDFLETSLGWRWFSALGKPVMPKNRSITLQPFFRRTAFSFKWRDVAPKFNREFYYLQGGNMSYAWMHSGRHFEEFNAEGLVPALGGRVRVGGCHTSFQYFPPHTDSHLWDEWQWITNRNYFATNPEYYSMNEGGARTPFQLCFGNPELRDAFTRRAIEHIELLGEGAVITVGAEDSGGTFCHCDACRELGKRYESSAGAYFDYLFELCEKVAEVYPGAFIKGVAYRREQTQKPPRLPAGKHFPDNFIILFAPINDPYLGDWSHPAAVMQESLADLRRWCALSQRVWVFYYPSPYGSGRYMPVGNVKRLVNDLRIMHQLGVEGIYLEEVGSLWGVDFSELHPYLFAKLTRDIDADVERLIEEFTDSQYGSAGRLVRVYLKELEQARVDMAELPARMSYSSRMYDPELWPYLTADNLYRWQGYFDSMEKKTESSPAVFANVRRLRRNLDHATLLRWLDISPVYPQYFSDYKVFSSRIRGVNSRKAEGGAPLYKPLENRVTSIFESIIRAGGEKPLPKQFEGTDRNLVRTLIPEMFANNKYHQGFFDDPEAAFGHAPSVHSPEEPFNFGFYQSDTKQHGVRRSIAKEEITPGVYKLYKLGTITISPQSQIWFSSRSWSTKVVLDDLWEPGDPNRWEAYASLKFQGPLFGGVEVEGLRSDEKDLILADRVILVKLDE